MLYFGVWKLVQTDLSRKKTMKHSLLPRRAYTSDLTDAQWDIMQPMIPRHASGRPCTTDMREVLNAIFYLMTNGCGWRNLSHALSRRHSPPKAPFETIFINGDARDSWIKSTIRYENRCVSRRDANPLPAQVASIRKVSNLHAPPDCEDLMRHR